MKENKITFFEEINFGSSERMHSEIIRQILSGNCSGIKGDNLKKIYKDFLEIEINDKKDIIFSGNEINKFDIFIKTKKNIIVIENKLKSSEHSNQLDRYLEKKDLCLEKEDKYKEKKFFFLTLIKEEVSNNEWRNITYNKLYNALNNIKLLEENIFIENYIYYLGKITEFHEEFLENFQNYPTVFKNLNIKKIDKDEKFFEGIKSDLEKFVAKNQLETIFQKSFLLNIMNEEKEKIDVFIDETHGTELLNIVLEKDIEYNGKKFDILLQLQGETIKFVFASQDYYNSDKEDLGNMLDVFEKISTDNLVNNGFNKINKPKSKGYISLSKKFLEISYWKKEKKDIIYKIKDEIDKSKKIVEIIMEYIKKDHKKSKE